MFSLMSIFKLNSNLLHHLMTERIMLSGENHSNKSSKYTERKDPHREKFLRVDL